MTVAVALAITLTIAIGTYLLRAAPSLLLADRTLPPFVQMALRNVGPAVLAALVVVSVASTGADGEIGIEAAEVLALAVAGAVAWRWRNLIWSAAAGMVALWVALAVTSALS